MTASRCSFTQEFKDELTVTERARLKELERENQKPRAETAFLEKQRLTFAREQR